MGKKKNKQGKLLINPTNEGKFDPQLAEFCWLHPNIRPENRDKIKMKPGKRMEDGVLMMFRTCPKCFNFVKVDMNKAMYPHSKVEGFSQEVKPEGLVNV